MEKKHRLSGIIYLIGAVYLASVVWATIYAQTGYRDSLPSVKLGIVVDGEIPMTALDFDEATGMYTLYTVERQDGPWGYDYRVQAVKLVNFMPIDEDTMFLFGATKIEGPVVLEVGDGLADGMKVRLK